MYKNSRFPLFSAKINYTSLTKENLNCTNGCIIWQNCSKYVGLVGEKGQVDCIFGFEKSVRKDDIVYIFKARIFSEFRIKVEEDGHVDLRKSAKS